MTKKKVVLLTNIPSPYNVDLFWYLQKYTEEYEFYPVYTSKTEDNRQWNVKENRMINTTILDSRVIRLSTGIDHRYVHLPPSIAPTLNRIEPDVVIAWEYNPAALMALSWCKKKHIPFIHVTEGTLHSEQNLNLIQKWSRKRIVAKADGYIAASSKSKEKLIYWGAKEEKIEIALLTIDISDYLNSEYKPISGRILFVGRVVELKGLDLLFKALTLLKDSFQLRIVGDGDESDVLRLKQLSEDYHISDSINWCGYKGGKDLLEEYQNASVFVLPTKNDCFGLVLLEAMASGVPVVSSKYADGVYDIIKDGVNGRIVDPYNSDELAGAISGYLNNTQDMRIGNEELINKFRYNDIADHYYKAIEAVLGNK